MNRQKQSGFSLVEILVVITIIGLLVTMVASFATNMLDNAHATACQSNLKQISEHMVLLKNERRKRNQKGWPEAKGIRFLLELTQGGRFASVSGKETKIFICPGTEDVNTLPDDSDPGSAYRDLDNLDSYSISYAGRNQLDFPLEKDPAGDDAILAADDNEGRANHRSQTNYVTVSAAVDSIDIRDWIDEYPELEYFPVGPDSFYEPFQKLTAD